MAQLIEAKSFVSMLLGSMLCAQQWPLWATEIIFRPQVMAIFLQWL